MKWLYTCLRPLKVGKWGSIYVTHWAFKCVYFLSPFKCIKIYIMVNLVLLPQHEGREEIFCWKCHLSGRPVCGYFNWEQETASEWGFELLAATNTGHQTIASGTQWNKSDTSKIWGFHGGDYEECRLLGYNKTSSYFTGDTLLLHYRVQPVNAM
jgi:hypothetical protein